MDDDVGLRRLERAGGIVVDAHAEPPRQTDHVGEIAAGLRRIDIDGADDLEAWPARHLPRHGRTDRPEAEVHHANVGHGRAV